MRCCHTCNFCRGATGVTGAEAKSARVRLTASSLYASGTPRALLTASSVFAATASSASSRSSRWGKRALLTSADQPVTFSSTRRWSISPFSTARQSPVWFTQASARRARTSLSSSLLMVMSAPANCWPPSAIEIVLSKALSHCLPALVHIGPPPSLSSRTSRALTAACTIWRSSFRSLC